MHRGHSSATVAAVTTHATPLHNTRTPPAQLHTSSQPAVSTSKRVPARHAGTTSVTRSPSSPRNWTVSLVEDDPPIGELSVAQILDRYIARFPDEQAPMAALAIALQVAHRRPQMEIEMRQLLGAEAVLLDQPHLGAQVMQVVPHLGAWALPGGHADLGGTSLRGTAAEELVNQCGVTDIRCLDAWDGPCVPLHIDVRIVDVPQLTYVFQYLFIPATDGVRPEPADDTFITRWVPLKELAPALTEKLTSRLTADSSR